MRTCGRISRLTPAQEAMIRDVAESWAAVERAVGPEDRAAAEEGVRLAYEACGLPPPAFVVWLGSPWAGLIGQAMLPDVIATVLRGRAGRVRARLRRRSRQALLRTPYMTLHPEAADRGTEQISKPVDARVSALLRLRPSPAISGWRFTVHGQLRDQVEAQRYVLSSWADRDGYFGSARYDIDVVPAVHAELLAQVSAQAGVPVPENVAPRLPRRWWRGQPVSSWGVMGYAWYEALERIGVSGMEVFHGEQQVARHAGYWWACRDYAVLTPRPDVQRWDTQGRLHCADGPAVVWPDGWSLHCWHGTRVPDSLIAGRWDPDRILWETTNVELRRCAIEWMGWPEFVEAAELRRVGPPEPDPGNPGQWLTLYELPGRRGRARVLLCTNASVERDGTRRQYGLLVPADTPDPTTAAARLLGLTREQYLSMARAT